jgi:peptidoglycan/LPS O-acetylase OafA/YrhL
MPSTKVFFPNLNGLRFVAFFAVFVNHAVNSLDYKNNSSNFNYIKKNFLQNGDLGVDFFFVLSGFLITYLLLKEIEISGTINLRNFYMRRVLRIWPLYFFIVGLCLFVLPFLQNRLPFNFPLDVSIKDINPLFYLTFAGNFDYLYNGINNVLIGILWSVSIEEQFYLFWPVILFFIPVKYLLHSFILIVICSIGFRYFHSYGGNAMIINYHSLSCVTYLAFGAIIAYLSTKSRFVDRVKRMPRYLIILIYVNAFMLLPYRIYIWKFGFYYLAVASVLPVLLAAFFAFVIVEQNYAQHSFYKIGRLKFISSLGKYTYGMYCYHMIVFFIIMLLFHSLGFNVVGMNKYVFISIVVVSITSTIIISKISFDYFESKILRIKDKFFL